MIRSTTAPACVPRLLRPCVNAIASPYPPLVRASRGESLCCRVQLRQGILESCRVSVGAMELQATTRGKKAKPINPTIFFIPPPRVYSVDTLPPSSQAKFSKIQFFQFLRHAPLSVVATSVPVLNPCATGYASRVQTRYQRMLPSQARFKSRRKSGLRSSRFIFYFLIFTSRILLSQFPAAD